MTAGLRAGTGWLPYGSVPSGRPRLFCIPNAGGAASTFAPWRGLATAGVEVCPIQLPGRAERFAEAPHERATVLVDALLAAIGHEFTGRYVLFGHSMGAALAYELARRFAVTGTPPVHLVVSGRSAPHLADVCRPLRDLPLDELIAELRTIGGTPEAILRERELMDRLQVLLRADFSVNETYRCPAGEPLDVPLTVLGGDSDPRAPVASLHAWEALTTGAFDVRVYPGGHFFLQDRPAELVRLMCRLAAG